MLRNLPINNPRPDGKHFVDVMCGRVKDTATPLVEFLVDDEIMRPILADIFGRTWVDEGRDRESQKAYYDNLIFFWYQMGYSLVRYERGLPFNVKWMLSPDVIPGSKKQRAWMEQHEGLIRGWEDFERYHWPTMQEMDFFPFEYINRNLPAGMGLAVSHDGGVLEHLELLMTYEGLCYALYDNPDLVKAVSDKVGELTIEFYKHILDLDHIIAIFPGDDMGFRSGTLIRPDDLRTYILPWHKQFARIAHERGVPYFLHSCGNIAKIMDDLIEDVRIDGKHSFEDAILPVQDFQLSYGDRIATLGGIDINTLTRGSPEQIRQVTHSLIETCGSRGRYAIGSGNSIPSYIPVENYLAMIDEALEVR